ncbi:MAG: DUF4112 domain-containing protein [Cyanobacteria bacterium P01_A01_bin.84]
MSLPPSQFYSIDPETKAPTLKRLRVFSRVLDRAITIPGTGIGIGLDPILGFLPIGGDFIGVMLSAYIVLEAARLGASKATLGKMVWNIILDGLVGVIPVLGDFFDFAWKANNKNIKLLEDHLKFPTQRKKADGWFILVMLLGLFLFAIALVALTVFITRLLAQLFVGG